MQVTVNGDIVFQLRDEDVNELFPVSHAIRNGTKVKQAKKMVKQRDKVCKCCGDFADGHLEAHHIFPVSKYHWLVADTDNMITLCQRCHRKYHETYDEVNPVTFAEFMKNYGEK